MGNGQWQTASEARYHRIEYLRNQLNHEIECVERLIRQHDMPYALATTAKAVGISSQLYEVETEHRTAT